MNKKIFTYAGVFCLGAAVGSVITFTYIKKKFEELAEQEIEEAREYFSKEWSRVIHKPLPKGEEDDAKEDIGDDRVIGIKVRDSDSEDAVDYTHYYTKRNIFDDYDPAEFESPSEKDIEEEVEDDAGEQMTIESEKLGDLILRITPESYAYDFPQHDKQTMVYYIEDETLVTEDEEIIDDISRIVGSYEFDDSIETIYFRNGKMGTDYEIEKVPGSFR